MKTCNGLIERALYLPLVIGCCLFLTLNGCNNTNTEITHAKATAPGEMKPKSMAIISDPEEHLVSSEKNSLFRCPDNQFMTGRHHYLDESKPTWYFCSKGFQFQEITITNKTWTPLVSEWDTDYVQCAKGQVVTGREHRDDERGKSRLECGTPIGYAGPMQVTPENPWIPIDHESLSVFNCPENRVMVGRYHYGDENGPTKYLCATLW